MYIPDGWRLVKITDTGTGPYYKLEEICCGDCENDNTWTCHICENTYDKSVEECPNAECNEITRKDEILEIINDYIDDGSTWILSECGKFLSLDIERE